MIHQSVRYAIYSLTFFVTTCNLLCASAFPILAGTCVEGGPAVGGSHVSNPLRYDGTLDDVGIQVNVGGKLLKTNDSNPLVFETGKNYAIEVLSTSYPYKGLLVRIQSGDKNIDLTSSLTPALNTKHAEACTSPIGGIDHTDSSEKKTAIGIVRLDEPNDVFIDVTVVFFNNVTASVYGYSRYQIKFEGDIFILSDSPSTTPSDIPSDIPSTVPSSTTTSLPPTVTRRLLQRTTSRNARMLRKSLMDYLKDIAPVIPVSTSPTARKSSEPSQSPNILEAETPSTSPTTTTIHPSILIYNTSFLDDVTASPNTAPIEFTTTSVPSISPITAFPTKIPTTDPIKLPSIFPSDLPLSLSRDSKGEIPSIYASDIPSSVLVPSDIPSSVRSDIPSSVPSDLPSTIPSLAPYSTTISPIKIILETNKTKYLENLQDQLNQTASASDNIETVSDKLQSVADMMDNFDDKYQNSTSTSAQTKNTTQFLQAVQDQIDASNEKNLTQQTNQSQSTVYGV